MRKLVFLITGLFFTGTAQTQVLKISPGSDLTILSGTIFTIDSLTLIPSANFTISDNTLSRFATLIHTSSNPYISRVYQFANNTSPFTGSVQISYRDTEVNGIPENLLTLNINNGTAWIFYPASFRDAINNFVLTHAVTINSMSELTLAHLSTPLPLSLLSFTATKQNKTALLQWATAQEQNTRNYEVQHSSNGTNWGGIGTRPAAGNSSVISNYSYIHTTPITGINYYRILQNDMNNRDSYSEIRTLKFTTDDEPFIVLGNPVTNELLSVQVNIATTLAFYTADGKLLWQEAVNAGTRYIDVSRYAKGIYFLKANSSSQKIMIQ